MTAPSDILLHILATFLMPLFLGGPTGNNDPDHARAAAIEVLRSFRFRDACELFLCVQITAFSMAALGSTALSMTDGISLSMILRLRGNANACNRSAETNRRALSAARAENEADQLRAADEARDAAFHARYTDEQVRADIAETRRMAEAVDAERRHSQVLAEGTAAWQELKESCERRVAAEQQETARTGIPVVVPPLPPLDPSIETISMEEFLNAPPGFSLIDTTSGPRKTAEAADPLTDGPLPVPPIPPQPATSAPNAGQPDAAHPASSGLTEAATVPAQEANPTKPEQTAMPHAARTATAAKPAKTPGANPAPAKSTEPQRTTAIHQPPNDDAARRSAWATAMLHVAGEFSEDQPHVSPEERRLNKIRANALSSVARTLLSGTEPAAEPYFKWPAEPGSPPQGNPPKR